MFNEGECIVGLDNLPKNGMKGNVSEASTKRQLPNVKYAPMATNEKHGQFLNAKLEGSTWAILIGHLNLIPTTTCEHLGFICYLVIVIWNFAQSITCTLTECFVEMLSFPATIRVSDKCGPRNCITRIEPTGRAPTVSALGA